MQNLLPTVPDKLEETLRRVDRISNWRPDDADPVRATVDRKLVSEFTVDKVEVIKYRQAVLPKPEPNYVSPLDIGSVDPSPLNAAVRAEEVEESVINMEGMRVDSGIPVLVKPKKKKVSTKFDHFLYTKFYSKMPVITDLYVQKLLTMKVMALRPFGELLRLIEGDPKYAQYVGYNGVHMMCSPLLRSTVAMTTRREIKDYHFNKYERIGLEVEMVDGKLTCTRVVPGTQAADHSLYLDSAEIVGVNGERVLTLEEFQRAMQIAKQEKFFFGELPDENEAETPIILTVAAFRGGKSKIDEVYLHSFAQRERMKSLFSNIFAGGGGRNNNHNDDDTSVNSADESRDASFSVPEGDSSVAGPGSVYEEAAEAARKAVEAVDDNHSVGNLSHSTSNHSLKSSPSLHRFPSNGSVYTLTSSHSRRRRLKDSDDEDDDNDAKSGLGINSYDDDDEKDEKDVDDKSTASSYHSAESKSSYHDHHVHAEGKDTAHHSHDAKSVDHKDDNGMMVSTVQYRQDVDVHYYPRHDDDDEGKEEEDGAMRAGRKRVQRETLAPEADEVVVVPPVEDSPPTPPPPEPVQVAEVVPLKQSSAKREKTPPTILPFTSLVCVPSSLRGSVDWGLPESYIQFTNFTTHSSWKMEIFWVDAEGALVPRHELKSGHTHMDMCNADHVWAIIARPHHDAVTKPMSRGLMGPSASTLNQQSGSLLVHDKSMGTLNDNSATDQVSSRETVDVKQPLIMIFRPCVMALQAGKCLTVIWTPWQSLSISHVIYPQTKQSRPRKNSVREQHAPSGHSHRDAPRVQPAMHIQLFETPAAKLQAISGQPNVSHAANAAEALLASASQGGDDQSTHTGAMGGASRTSNSHHSVAEDLHSTTGDSVSLASQHSATQSSVRTSYTTVQRTLADFKAAIKASDSRYQSQRDQFEQVPGAKIQRKPLVTSGALHRMRKDHK